MDTASALNICYVFNSRYSQLYTLQSNLDKMILLNFPTWQSDHLFNESNFLCK